MVEVHHTGDPELRADVVAAIEHVFADRPRDWRVSIVGSQANDLWEMKIAGPDGFERSYTLEGSSGEHQPDAKSTPGRLAAKFRPRPAGVIANGTLTFTLSQTTILARHRAPDPSSHPWDAFTSARFEEAA